MDRGNERVHSRWHRYVQAAVDFPRLDSTQGENFYGDSATADSLPSQPPSRPGAASALSRKIRADIRGRLLPDGQDVAATEPNRRRTDLRLAPAALLVWAATVAGPW